MRLAGPVHFLTHTHTTHLALFLGSPNGWVKGGRGGSKPQTKKTLNKINLNKHSWLPWLLLRSMESVT